MEENCVQFSGLKCGRSAFFNLLVAAKHLTTLLLALKCVNAFSLKSEFLRKILWEIKGPASLCD